jgi:adenylosuccinate synthase
MPVSIVVGGQYGSEGKGKVALAIRRARPDCTFVIRPGGTNSGHTGYDKTGQRIVLRQFPAAAIDGDVSVIFPAGSYIDPELFLHELAALGLPDSRVFLDRRAQIILPEHRRLESDAGLIDSIGSTGSGTGAAVLSRLARYGEGIPKGVPVEDVPELARFIRDVPAALDGALANDERVLIEGTQGYGLSPLHGESWPKATSRDTIAASFLSEAGLAPLVVDEVALVLRAYPIRVAGDSGPLLDETSWEQVTKSSGSSRPLHEYTSVTNKLRRVGLFDPLVVRQAIRANRPSRIILNHVDYIDASLFEVPSLTPQAKDFISFVSDAVGHRITDIGTGPSCLFPMHARNEAAR